MLLDKLTPGVRHAHNPMRLNVNVMGDERSPHFDWSGFRLEQMFFQMLERSGETFRRVFAHLAEAESYPYVFHCAAGKDRTGVTAALLLRTAGVPDATIVAGTTLERSSAYDGTVQFAASTGTPQLDNSSRFAGTVAGMAGQDTFDLRDINPATVQVVDFEGHPAGHPRRPAEAASPPVRSRSDARCNQT